MKKIITLICIALMLTFTANAIVINQVLYNPSGTESGGEAIELYNNENNTKNIGNWKIATEASSRDATIPANTTLCAGCYYLIADTGWSTKKDNSEWPNANYEELINLYNSNSGIALMNGDNIIDALGWGEKSEIGEMFYKGEPANEVEEGKALKRTSNTGNNSNDFEESIPLFNGASTIESEYVDIDFEVNENSQPKILISNSKLDFGKIDSGKDYEKEFKIENVGNIKVNLKIKCIGFEGINQTIIEIISDNYAGKCETIEKIINLNINPNENKTLKIKINTPQNTNAGKYSGRIMITPIKS